MAPTDQNDDRQAENPYEAPGDGQASRSWLNFLRSGPVGLLIGIAIGVVVGLGLLALTAIALFLYASFSYD